MIDQSLTLSASTLTLYYLRKAFFLYFVPFLVGFATVVCYQVYSRIATSPAARRKLPVFLASALSAMAMMLGWSLMVRTMAMVPFYGCGVGLANVVTSQVYAVFMPVHRVLRFRFPKVVWRSDIVAVEDIRNRMSARQ